LTVRHPHTDLPYRPKQCHEYYERVSVADVNRWFEAAGVPWRLDNDGETADPLFDTEWWNLHQALAWVYLGDRALVKQGALVNEGAAFAIQLKLEATERQGACYPSFSAAEKAIGEALQTGKLTAYGLRNGEGDLVDIPSVQWGELKTYWGCDSADHAGPSDCFRPMASRWFTLRFKRKAILALWPDPLDQLDHLRSAEEQSVGPAAEARSSQWRAHDKRKTLARNEGWQEEINRLAKEHPQKRHSDLCRILAKDTGTDFQTIRRNTKLSQT
jgi:hypothetical protein